MNLKVFKVSQSLITCNTVFILSLLFVFSFGYHEMVNKLQNYVETNETFAVEINETFKEGLAPHATYTDMYQFFDEYISKAPPADILKQSFNVILSRFGLYTSSGSKIFSSRIAQQWFQSYMHQVMLFCDSADSTNVIPGWEAKHNIDMTQYIIPQHGYQSFNDFFARKIKPECRPIDSAQNDSIIVSPCDGEIVDIQYDLSSDTNICVKGVNYSLATMLMNDYYAKQFIGGTLIHIYLHSHYYHRFHCSVSGYTSQIDAIGGYQFWMPADLILFTDNYYKWLPYNNRRTVLYVDTGKFGVVAHNYVGVWLVNSIDIHIDPGDYVSKGDETGNFKYGGSSIVVLFQKDALKQVLVEKPQMVNFGQRIAIANMNFKTQREISKITVD